MEVFTKNPIRYSYLRHMNSKSLNENLNDAQKNLRNYRGSKKDKCFFTDCNSTSIKSHSISESRVLSLLEGMDKKNKVVVYHLEDVPEVDFGDAKSISTYKQTHRKLFKKGKGDTSVFFGFCNDCDRDVFDIIDNNDYQNTTSINFLHTIRTLAYNLTTSRNIYMYMVDNIINKYPMTDEKIEQFKKLIFDLGKIIEQQPDDKLIDWEEVMVINECFHQINTNASRALREDTEKFKNTLLSKINNESNYPMRGDEFKANCTQLLTSLNDSSKSYTRSLIDDLKISLNRKLNSIETEIEKVTSLYRNSNHDYFSFLHRYINGVFHIAGAFVYRFTLNDDECIVTFFPEESTKKTHVIFAVRKVNSKYLAFLNIKTDTEFNTYLSNIILTGGTNVFISPTYWNKLPKDIQDLILLDKADFKEHNINLFDNKYLPNSN